MESSSSKKKRKQITSRFIVQNYHNNLVAIPKDDYLDLNTRSSRQGHSKQILVKSSDRGCNAHKYSFFPRTILDWKELSQDRDDQFKHFFKKHYLNQLETSIE